MTQNGNPQRSLSWQPDYEELKLSKGSMLVRTISVIALLEQSKDGEIPQFLANEMISGLTGKKKKQAKLQKPKDMTSQEFAELTRFMKLVVKAAAVDPVVVEGKANYNAGQISFADLSDEDIGNIFAAAMPGESLAASNFRAERDPVEHLPALEE